MRIRSTVAATTGEDDYQKSLGCGMCIEITANGEQTSPSTGGPTPIEGTYKAYVGDWCGACKQAAGPTSVPAPSTTGSAETTPAESSTQGDQTTSATSSSTSSGNILPTTTQPTLGGSPSSGSSKPPTTSPVPSITPGGRPSGTSPASSSTSPSSRPPGEVDMAFCKGRPIGYYPDVKDCKSFFHCANGITYWRHCPEGLYLNLLLGFVAGPKT